MTPPRVWISTAYGRPSDSWTDSSYSHTAALWIGEPWRCPFVAPNHIAGGTSAEDARWRVQRAVCMPGVVVIELKPEWARAARFNAKGLPPWPEGRKAKQSAGGSTPRVVATGSFRALQAFLHLGLTPPFTERDVRRAYRRLALLRHPDRGGSAEAFIALKAAYDTALAVVAA